MSIPQLHITDADGTSRQGVAGETGSQVLAEAKRLVASQNAYAAETGQPEATVIDWWVAVNGKIVFSKAVEDRRADDMLTLAAGR